jgi:hypothetical protein
MDLALEQTRGAAFRETDDLSFAAYAFQQGLRVVKGSSGRAGFAFTFADPDDRWEGLKVDWANSPEAAYDNAVRQLKNLSRNNRT